jgi:hypothetical protein
MPHARTAALLVAVLAGLWTPLAASCGGNEAPAPVIVPPEVHLASATPLPAMPPALATPAGGTPSAADRLEAARTVALYCGLLDDGQYARAGALCSRRRLWSRRVLATLRHLGFRSARVYAAPDARTLVLEARVRVRAGRGCPLPDGLATLFFTLGRVGSAVGGWLITAVSTRP